MRHVVDAEVEGDAKVLTARLSTHCGIAANRDESDDPRRYLQVCDTLDELPKQLTLRLHLLIAKARRHRKHYPRAKLFWSFKDTCMILFFAGVVLLLGPSVALETLSIWPYPSAVESDGTCIAVELTGFSFTTKSSSALLSSAFGRYLQLMALGNIAQPCSSVLSSQLSALIVDVLSTDEVLGPSTDESYTLVLSSDGSASLTAVTVYGALHGLETFSQLVFTQSGRSLVPTVFVNDTARFNFRAIMIDTARLFRPVPLLKQFLDAMSWSKFNVLYLHLTDNGSWTLEIKAFPLLTTKCNADGVYSQSDIADLVMYARQRGIRLIPEIDSPGHFDTARCYPELLTLAAYPCPGAGPGTGFFRATPDPSNAALWSFFATMYAELGTLFPDEYTSLGGDEAWLAPWGCSTAVEEWMAKNNLTVDTAAQWYEKRVYSIATATGKRALMWAPGQGVASNSTIHLVWHGWSGSGGCWQCDFQDYTAAGQAVVLSGPWYLDKTPDWTVWYHVDPRNFTGSDAQEALVLGGMGTIWSDLVKEDIVARAWPLMNAVGEQLWSPAEVTSVLGAPTQRYNDHCKRLIARGLLDASGCEPPQPPQPPSCTARASTKLNNTDYADGNGPRTAKDPADCCAHCSATAGCSHWSFNVDQGIPGTNCKWETLTYCCWLHTSNTNPVSAAGWSSSS